MTKGFKLLEQLRTPPKDEKEISLDKLKESTGQYLAIYNQLVHKSWAMQYTMEHIVDKSEKEKLEAKLIRMKNQLEHYDPKPILERLKAREMQENGVSNIGSQSPYVL